MESSKILGGAEEDSSSESGWTMYIDSSSHEVYDSDQDNQSTDKHTYDYRKDNRYNNNQNDDDNESDDSMASDASSGPSHQLSWGSSKQSLSIGYFKQAATKYPSKQEPNRPVKKKDHRTQAEKSVIKAKSTASHVQSGTKMRKTN